MSPKRNSVPTPLANPALLSVPDLLPNTGKNGPIDLKNTRTPLTRHVTVTEAIWLPSGSQLADETDQLDAGLKVLTY